MTIHRTCDACAHQAEKSYSLVLVECDETGFVIADDNELEVNFELCEKCLKRLCRNPLAAIIAGPK